MGINSEQLITLRSFKGVGEKTVEKVIEAIKSGKCEFATPKETVEALLSLGIRKKEPVTVKEYIRTADVVRQMLECSERMGIGVTTIVDSDYPKRLLKTTDENGSPSVPQIIFYKGSLNVASLPSVAVIGTRNPTHYGVEAGIKVGAFLAEKGVNVVSGLALGCDTSAHKGAISVPDGVTTAFLAHGLDSVYPEENEELAENILSSGGLLMSEYPIGTRVNRYNLVNRDRLQASLSDSTVVIQTGVNGGTMHAVRTTFAQGKKVYCLLFKNSSFTTRDFSAGFTFLINKGAEILTSDNMDIVFGRAQMIVKDEKKDNENKVKTIKQLSLFND